MNIKLNAWMLLLTIVLTSCAAISSGADGATDPIVGRWRGTGFGAQMVWEFRKNYTFKDGWGEPGVWKKEGERQYHLYADKSDPNDPEDGRVFTLTPEDQLVSDMFVFVREGAAKKKIVSPTPEALAGEWVFVYTRNTAYTMAPPFDRVHFKKDGDVISTSTIVSHGNDGKYKLSGDRLKFSKMGPKNISSQVTASMEDDGKTLILIPQAPPPINPDWVYVRPAQLLPNDEVLGKWTGEKDKNGLSDMVLEIQLLANGHFEKTFRDDSGKAMTAPRIDPKAHAYFRLWTSKYGKMITMVDLVPEMGLLSDTCRYELVNGTLILTPLTSSWGAEPRLDESAKVIYKALRDNHAAPATPVE